MFATMEDGELLASVIEVPPARKKRFVARLEAIGGLGSLWTAGSEPLDGVIDAAEIARLDRVLQLMRRILAPGLPATPMADAASVAAYFRPRLALCAEESFWIMALDARLRPIACLQIAKGSLTACLIHPREVFAAAVRSRAASIIAVHNHPSGDPEPSHADELLTDRLFEAGQILGIPLVDHVIVARGGYRSLGRPQACAAP